MFALESRLQDTFFDSDRKSVAMVTAIMAKMGEKSCVANYFLSFSPILMKFGTDALGLDVQDTFFDSECVAMVTAYYEKWGGKYCVATFFTNSLFFKFGTDVCLGV